MKTPTPRPATSGPPVTVGPTPSGPDDRGAPDRAVASGRADEADLPTDELPFGPPVDPGDMVRELDLITAEIEHHSSRRTLGSAGATVLGSAGAP